MLGKNLTKKPWILGTIGVYIIATSLLYFLLLKPSFGKVGKMKIQRDLVEDYRLVRKVLQDFESKLLKEDELPSVLSGVNEIAKEVGVKLKSVDLDRSFKATGKSIAEIPIKLKLRSPYHNLGVFLNRLEKSQKFLAIADLELYSHDAEFTLYCFKGK